jgi:signal transduction histidine kinase
MSGRALGASHILILAGVTTAAVYLLGGLSLALTGRDQALWPCNAIALCALLRLSRDGLEDAVTFVGVAMAGFLANLHTGQDPFLATTYGLTNAGEVAMGVLLARRFAPLRFPTPLDGWKFCGIVGLAPPLVGAICAWLAALSTGAPHPWVTARNWYLADLLGFLVLAPYGMTLAARQLRQLRMQRATRAAEAVFYLVLTGAAAALVFLMAHTPLSFVMLPVMLATTFRFRLWGGAAAVAIVTVISIPATTSGLGPFGRVDPDLRVLLLQAFLALSALSCVTVAALLNERDVQRALLNRKRKEAELLSEAKSRLLAHVGHEVKSPLTAIINFGTLIENGLLRPDQVQLFAAAITKHGALLKGLSDDLLDMAKADAGALTVELEAVSLDDVLEDLAQAVAVQRGGELVIRPTETHLRLRADPQRYAQVLNNLVGNALRHGRGYGPVEIEARRLDDGFLRVEVSNGGPGIEPEQQAKVFTPFDGLGAETGEIEGPGLGLSIAKRLVELQGGRIDFESQPGRRTRFWVDMPRAA